MEKSDTNSGITLIALMITIIVMLILVGVSISTAVNGGLFGYAGNATRETENARDQEKEIAEGKIQIENEKYNSIDEYLYGKPIIGHDGETFSAIYTETKEYSDGTNIAVIPKGFAVGTSKGIDKIETGLVIRDEIGNEFVWIPVEKAIITENEINTLKTKYNVNSNTTAVAKLANEKGIYPMAVEVIEEDNEGKKITNYKGILYKFEGTKTLTVNIYDWADENSTREPAVVNEEAEEYTEKYFINTYNQMVKSVEENKGFYVGRYEISEGSYTVNESTVKYAQSQPGKTAITSTWYNMYEFESNYAKYNSNLGVTSEMIWGSQWDQMMIFVNGKDDGSIELNPFYVTIIGNRMSNDISIKTGMNKVDQVVNIFDLEASRHEWTQEKAKLRTDVCFVLENMILIVLIRLHVPVVTIQVTQTIFNRLDLLFI